jgi:hypothetical protein
MLDLDFFDLEAGLCEDGFARFMVRDCLGERGIGGIGGGVTLKRREPQVRTSTTHSKVRMYNGSG